jgi:hypothetical protein
MQESPDTALDNLRFRELPVCTQVAPAKPFSILPHFSKLTTLGGPRSTNTTLPAPKERALTKKKEIQECKQQQSDGVLGQDKDLATATAEPPGSQDPAAIHDLTATKTDSKMQAARKDLIVAKLSGYKAAQTSGHFDAKHLRIEKQDSFGVKPVW